MTKIFVTGITGLVGSAFAVQLIRERDDYEIVALARGGANQNAADRTEEIIREQCKYDHCPEVTEKVLSKLTVLEGDIVTFDPEDESIQDAIEGCKISSIVPQMLTLEKILMAKPSRLIMRVLRICWLWPSILTQKNFIMSVLLLLLVALKAPHTKIIRLTMVSLTHMRKANIWLKDWSVTQDFRFLCIVRQLLQPLSDGMTRKPLAFYRVLEFVAKVKKHICTKHGLDAAEFAPLTFRFDTRPSDQVYFSPIDFISDSIVKIFQLPVANKAYHLTGARPTSTDDITQSMQETLRVGHVNVIAGVSDKSKEEKLINKFLGDLLPYFSSRIHFDQTNVREALGEDAINWHYDVAGLDVMMKEYYRHFFPNVEWLQKICAD